jgi:LPS export ABC transporter protein LptC
VRMSGKSWAWVLLVGVVAVAGCTDIEQASGPDQDAARLPDQQIYDYRLIDSEAGVTQWILGSQRMEKYAGREDVELYDLEMQFYDEGKYFSTLTAERGRANLQTKNLFAWGNVVVVTTDGRRLETEELHYDDAAGRIYNDVYNRFTWGEDMMTGNHLEATPDLKYLEIKEKVNADMTDQALGDQQR